MEPDVLNYGKPNRGPRLTPGLALAIEPMVTWGSPDSKTLADDWTVATVDDSLAAHWEHSIAITEGGVWVLTCEDGGEFELAARGVPFAPLGD
ncbi:helicase SKI2W [Platysternon megacephalum]|uniref:Helicase SKI2W n=1 Tax=Platysternon megacephalum TaxID=55544 RepID=A0A4D9DER9_9SAUR|nr:helicase SKI2W [Platysternon megacephalum]